MPPHLLIMIAPVWWIAARWLSEVVRLGGISSRVMIVHWISPPTTMTHLVVISMAVLWLTPWVWSTTRLPAVPSTDAVAAIPGGCAAAISAR